MKLQNSDRNVIYLRFDFKDLQNNTTLMLNTNSGALDVFSEKMRFRFDFDKEPSLVLNFKDKNNQILQDNALINFEKHQNRCEEIYKHLKYPMEKYDEEMDQNASEILNYLYEFDIETSKNTSNPLEGVGYTDSSYIESILNIKIKHEK